MEFNNIYQANDNAADRDVEMLKFFQEEFIHRHKLFWEILTKSFILVVVVALLPISSEVLGLVLDDIPLEIQVIFPILGILISIFSAVILWGENKRMIAVNDAKYYLNRQAFEEKHQYYFFNDNVGKTKNVEEEKKKIGDYLCYKVVIGVLILELIINLAVIMVILYPRVVFVCDCMLRR